MLITVTYELNCAPYLALRVLRHIADTECSDLLYVQRALRSQTYMDDICVGAESLEAAQNFLSNLIDTLARSGLQLKKWASNRPELLSYLRPEDCSGDPLAFEESDSVQVLGMRWNPGKDFFFFHINHFKLILTKRGVLMDNNP